MDSFNFTSHSSSTGPNDSFLQECPIKDYASDLMENTASLSSMSTGDFIPLDFPALHQGLIKVYYSLLDSANARNIGAGIVATALLYSSWKAIRVWTNQAEFRSAGEYKDRKARRRDVNKTNDHGEPVTSKALSSSSMERCLEAKSYTLAGHLTQTKSTETEELAIMCENLQRQLKETMSKLDEVKFRLKEVESDKELLTTEIDTRKQMIQKLQDENSCEREKRQQAELKMEMMSMEYSQIHQLRKEVALKSAHVEKLEKIMTEKDDLQMKLFSDNVVLPRCVVDARAKEFSDLQNRVHQLQAEVDTCRRFREFDVGCQPCRFSSSVWLEDGSLSLPAPYLGEMQTSSKKSFPTDTSIALPESIVKPKTKLTFADRSPILTQQMLKSLEKASAVSRSTTSTSVASLNKTPPNVKYIHGQDYQPAPNESPSLGKNDGCAGSVSMLNRNIGLFAQLRTLIKNVRDSNLDCDPANIALLTDLGTLLSGSRSNKNLRRIGEKLSDEKRSSFKSAVSDSDIDHTRVHDGFLRKPLSKKVTPLKRLSRYRRDRLKDSVLVKRKLAVQYLDGQARLIGLGESPAVPSASREMASTSTSNWCPLSGKAESKIQNSAGFTGDHHSTNLQSLKGCDEHVARGGDSWIVIIPNDL